MLGYAGVDNRGLAGLELSLDRELAGRPGRERIVKDASGQAIDTVVSQTVRDGRDVYLTLDHTIQANAQAVLRDTVLRWHAKSATAIVLDPTTGAVRAMAIAPGFDANVYPEVWRVLQRNRAVTDTYEPGSTFKLVTVAGALSEGLVNPNTRFTLPYEIQVADRRIHDAEPRGTETMSVSEILSRSSNVGAITLAERLTRHRLVHWISRFGFGQPTGIDFPGESAGDRAPGGQVVGLLDRQHPDRPGDRGHADPDGLRVRGDRQPRRLGAAAPRRPRRRRRRCSSPPIVGSSPAGSRGRSWRC